MTKHCPTCGTEYSDGEKVCHQDGSILIRGKNFDPEQLEGIIIDKKYKLERLLAQGGMGMVFRGLHILMDRAVAIKLIRSSRLEGNDYGKYIQRFQQEARLLSKIRHPNVVTLFDFGVVDLGQGEDIPYMVMEYIEGRTLKDALANENLPQLEILRIVCEMSEGLVKAHDKGILHRDIKPSNVLLTTDESEVNHPVLVDFGIATDSSVEAEITGSDSVVGTLKYIAPEQLTKGALDKRTDVYAVGLLLYELVSGKMPFPGKSPMESALKRVHTRPPSIETILGNGKIEKELDEVILKCLEPKPDNRFSSLSECIEALKDAVPALKGVASLLPPSKERSKTYGVGVATLLFLAVVAIGFKTVNPIEWFQRSDVSRKLKVAENEQKQALEDVNQAQAEVESAEARFESLLQQRNYSSKEVKKAEAAVKQAKQEMHEAEHSLESAQKEVDSIVEALN